MQVILTVHCTKGPSLRDAIARRLKSMAEPELIVAEEKRRDRNPGWSKLRSADQKQGVLNLRWSQDSWTLEGRVITKGTRKPSPIVGDFVNYLLNNHRSRVMSITLTSP
ncbi:MAG: hypothetical protein KJ061_18105 [Vicinamibacteraceae bacterium]|nr:hypothetical protein [Vicinamibacteraceae bacterium]